MNDFTGTMPVPPSFVDHVNETAFPLSQPMMVPRA
jgi:hypothetical protein